MTKKNEVACLICPMMSCRTTQTDPKNDTITPTVVKCQKQDCAVWLKDIELCGLIQPAWFKEKNDKSNLVI